MRVKLPTQDQPSLTNGLNLMHNKACRLEKIVPFGGSSINALSTSACINKVVDINDMHGAAGRRGRPSMMRDESGHLGEQLTIL